MYGERQRLLARISRIESEAGKAASDELKSVLANHLAVLASGYIEVSCREIIASFAKSRSDPRVARYVESRMSRFWSPGLEDILKLVEGFDDGVRQELADFAEGEIGDAVNSIVAIRHQIAHGAHNGTSLGVVSRYHTNVVKFVEKLEALFPPPP